MINSMTGFGRCEDVNEFRKIVVEIKSVNHRYCELSIKLPKKLNSFETAIRTLLKSYIQRGKVDVFIYYENLTSSGKSIIYNKELAKEYVNIMNNICEDFNINESIKATTISKFPDVITCTEDDTQLDLIWSDLSECIHIAARNFTQTRKNEGMNLYNDITSKLDYLKNIVSEIEKRSPEIVTEYRNKLYAKVNELLGDVKIDESILASEITIFADKICVDEETVRLRSHIDSMLKCLSEKDGIGRKLDFIAQEMNRESNTILSKANDITVSNFAIELKTEIEKIREQIQNIE